MPPILDSLREILDHKYRSEKFERIDIPYLENILHGSQLAYQYASSLKTSLVNDQYSDLSSLTRFNAYQELIHEVDEYLNQLSVTNLSITNIYASSIQGLIQQSQIAEFTTDVYASDILGFIKLSQIEEFSRDLHASAIIGLFNSDQINFLYQSQILGLSSTVYSSNLIGKIVSSQISSISASIISPYILSSQIESINIEITPIDSSWNFGYCLTSNPCLTTSGDYQPLVGGLDVIGALEALTLCRKWAYGVSDMTATNQLGYHSYYYHQGGGSSRFIYTTPAQLDASCFAYLIGASPTMPYNDS